MQLIKSQQKINDLTLILSCGCNLNCEYCLIAQSTNKQSPIIQQNTRKALEDGSFLKNTINTIALLGQSPSDIEHIQFWGQEPTLNLDLYTKNLKQWHENFPNIKSYMFSTNSKAFPEKIISFLIELDKYANPNTYAEIQFSYDGKYSNENIRKIDSNLIENNIKYIISELNQIIFTNIHIGFQFNGVITRELIYELNSLEKMNAFISHGEAWLNQFDILNKNNNIEIYTGIPFSPEVPYLCTVEDGIALNNFYSLLKQSNKYYVKHFLASFLRGFENRLQELKKYNTQISIIDALKFLSNLNFKNSQQKILYDLLAISHFCGGNYGALRIMYDGTILECHNLIFDTDLDYIKFKSNEEFYMKKTLIDKKRIINLLNNNEEKNISTLLYRGAQIETQSFFSIFNNAINLLYTMSCCGQAEEIYMHDKEKLLLHAYILTCIDTCPHDRRITTGSAYLINSGMVRFFCNGFLSQVIDDEGRIKELLNE